MTSMNTETMQEGGISPEDVIKVGDYIVIQKHNYKKLYKLNKPDCSVSIGRDNVNLSGIAGCPYSTVFKMIPKNKKGREFSLEETNEIVELKDEIDVKESGSDNRNIIDDGRSQKLTADEIRELANDANKASDIVETLISNSNTFHNKTEYSQEKYLRKKEKKYFEYVQILRPNLRLVADLMYKLEPAKIQQIRIDTLSQMMTMSNVQSEGVHLLYDSGSNGLIAAALLSLIGADTQGKLIHMHPGNMSQKQALLAMNFAEEQYKRCISVNIYSVLRQIYQGTDIHDKLVENNTETVTENDINSTEATLKRKVDDHDDDDAHKSKVAKKDESQDVSNGSATNIEQEQSIEDCTDNSVENSIKDKECIETGQSEPKKPKWHFDNITASELLTNKVDSLIIACKEDPLTIFNELLQFVKPSRPYVVYYPVAEPLQKMYVALRANPRTCAVRLTCNWMRNYQILPERTHPEVMMNSQSGFLLSGYILE